MKKNLPGTDGSLAAIITDTHFGAHKNSEWFHEMIIIWAHWLVAECKKRNIKKLRILGDIFNSRSTVNTRTLNWAIDIILEEFSWFDDIWIIVGNHDAYYKTSTDVASVNVFKRHKGITVFNEPTMMTDNDRSVMVLPWVDKLNDEKWGEICQEIQVDKADICMGHLEIKSFETHHNSFYTDGVEPENLVDKFTQIYSGHFHLRQERGNIKYIGCPYQLDWKDFANDKGFYVLNLDTLEDEFIPNNVSPVHEKYTVQWVLDNAKNPKKLNVKGNWIKLIVDTRECEKEDADKAYAILSSMNPFEIRKEVIYGDVETNNVEIDTSKLNNPIGLLFEYLESIDSIKATQKKRIKGIFIDLHDKIKAELK